MNKTVYVIGAGFSKTAGFPLQSEILSRVREFTSQKIDLLTAPRFTLSLVQDAGKSLYPFLESLFSQSEPDLEDVFTLLDQTIARKEYCRKYNWQDLEKIRDTLKRAILFVLHEAGDKIDRTADEFYQSIAAYLLEQRAKAGQKADPFSVIVLNWDSLLENSIYKCLGKLTGKRKADVDYCCYTTPLPGSPHLPSLLQKSRGRFNIKVMKLHGSSNWLLCPNCNRLFTGVGGSSSVWEQYAKPRACPSCSTYILGELTQPDNDIDSSNHIVPQLESFIVTPTFLKNFDNAHLQMTWHNAYIDLMEAQNVVFIGYSLPQADYHVRTLLKRAIRKDARITAVLDKEAEPKSNTLQRHKRFYPTIQYRQFFGKDRVTCITDGVEGYFHSVIGSKTLIAQLKSLRRILK